ncbi:class E sortase [Streptomyces albogriseolus]|uniref:class E sortase n=1 Tax=Streptomyces albogriseolus TaxID=1887 RepID=UPI00379CFE05
MAATADDTAQHTHASPPPRGRRRLGPVAMVISFFGEMLITAGVVLVLFVVYSLWWTNVVADRAADRQADKVRDSWAQESDGAERDAPAVYDSKNGIGFLHVPTMSDEDILVEKGTSMKVLNDGVAGFYTDPVKATLPTSGKKGNFSLAAHRDGHGAKFHGIHKIKKGDPVVFETKDTWFVYKVYGILPETSKYNVGVLAGVPEESGREKAGHYITLTTCTPIYTSKYRYIVWGELVRKEKVDENRTPPEELR